MLIRNISQVCALPSVTYAPCLEIFAAQCTGPDPSSATFNPDF